MGRAAHDPRDQAVHARVRPERGERGQERGRHEHERRAPSPPGDSAAPASAQAPTTRRRASRGTAAGSSRRAPTAPAGRRRPGPSRRGGRSVLTSPACGTTTCRTGPGGGPDARRERPGPPRAATGRPRRDSRSRHRRARLAAPRAKPPREGRGETAASQARDSPAVRSTMSAEPASTCRPRHAPCSQRVDLRPRRRTARCTPRTTHGIHAAPARSCQRSTSEARGPPSIHAAPAATAAPCRRPPVAREPRHAGAGEREVRDGVGACREWTARGRARATCSRRAPARSRRRAAAARTRW